MAQTEQLELIRKTGEMIRDSWVKKRPYDASPLLPDIEGDCELCLPWRKRFEALLSDFTKPDGNETSESLHQWLRNHWSLIHEPIISLPQKHLEKYVLPTPEVVRGVTTYYDPAEYSCGTDYSIAFFLLNGHRLGVIKEVEVVDAPKSFTNKEDYYALYVSGNNNRRLALSGCSAGYGGAGPQGTLKLLRLAGFPEIAPITRDGKLFADLEEMVFTQKSFRIGQ